MQVVNFDSPAVVLAPMAGITNQAYRNLCREASQEIFPGGGAALYVSEMITSRALLERDDETMRMISFSENESPRSIQLYGVDPEIMGKAVKLLVDEDRCDHIDLNMGCPVAKVTRKGGGSALPWKRDLFRSIIRSAVENAKGKVPVTVKMRKGIDDEHLTYLDAGVAAAQEGAAWVALHGRTALDLYSGEADWQAIANLKSELSSFGTPVLGNGDIWSGEDAKRMISQTGCDGVVIGRGCLGRPWLFGQISAAFAGVEVPANPNSHKVFEVMQRHAQLLVDYVGDETHGCREFRKHVAWYTKGFRVGGETRHALAMISSLQELEDLLASIEPQPYPDFVAHGPRGRTSGAKSVALPHGWLNSREFDFATDLSAAEIGVSGG
ncbi:MAG: tRNA dihydrouridine synthase DusB [Actinomycetota bacterium]|jgi:nifR3 family TIM-barrel protein